MRALNFLHARSRNFTLSVKEQDATLLSAKLISITVSSDNSDLCTIAEIRLCLEQEAEVVFRPNSPVSCVICDQVSNELTVLEGIGIVSPVNYLEWTTAPL